MPEKTLGKLASLPSVSKNTRQKNKFAEWFFLTLDKQPICQVFFLPSVFRGTLDKEVVCRVPEGWHSVNPITLGIYGIFGSILQLHS